MKFMRVFILILLATFSFSAVAANKIAEIEFVEASLLEVIRGLSELSDGNIIATQEASKKLITIHLKNVTVEEAIKSISRINDLWYRHDKDTNTYRVMTREEYSKDLVIQESEHIEIYKLLNANVRIVAQAINDLFSSRVVLTMGIEAGQSGKQTTGSSNSRNSSRNSRGSSASSNNTSSGSSASNKLTDAGSTIDANTITQQQLERLAALVDNRTLDGQSLREVTVKAQPIYVTVNNEHNMILVRTDDQAILNAIANLVEKMDQPIPQVMLEMKILNVVLGEDFNSLFNFSIKPSGSNQSIASTLLGNNNLGSTGSFVYEFLNSRLKANIEFLEQNNRIKVLSNPMVLASNHREAELFIGEENLLTRGFSYTPPTLSSSGAVTSPGVLTTETELRDIGITLKITPRINADKTVALDLEQESSTLNRDGQTIPVNVGDVIQELALDTVDTARLSGTVLAKDDLTVAVGGLIRTSKNRSEKKVPLLGEIPVIGRVFRSTTELEEETETVLLITPHILNNPEDSEYIRNQNNSFYKTHNANYADPALPANKFLDGPGATRSKDFIPTNSAQPMPAETRTQNRQQLYMEMSQFAADMMRTPAIERVKDSLYHYVPMTKSDQKKLVPDTRIQSQAQASWNRGGLYVTAVKVKNKSGASLPLDMRTLYGKWLAASTEVDSLAAGAETYLYLISALPFSEVM